MSEATDVYYFRCHACLMIWNKPKVGDGPINIVAPPAKPKNIRTRGD
jgi:hypothetical protein